MTSPDPLKAVNLAQVARAVLAAPAVPVMRTGRTLGRTLYLITPGEDRKADRCAGMMDTRELAEMVVSAVNERAGKDPDGMPAGWAALHEELAGSTPWRRDVRPVGAYPRHRREQPVSRPEFAEAEKAAATLRTELERIFPAATETQLTRAALAAGGYAARPVEVHARPAAGAGLLLPEREAS